MGCFAEKQYEMSFSFVRHGLACWFSSALLQGRAVPQKRTIRFESKSNCKRLAGVRERLSFYLNCVVNAVFVSVE